MAHWVITGGNRGIGFAIIKKLLEMGEKVTVGARKKPEVDSGNLRYIYLDVTDENSISDFAKEVERVDILINNAGVLVRDRFPNVTEENLTNTLKVNTYAPLFVVQELYKYNKLSPNAKILNISSILGSISNTFGTTSISYSVSKAGLNMITKVLSHYLKDYVVVSIHPGWVKTDMGGENAPVFPEESADGIIKLSMSLTLENTGKFFDYTGKEIEW